jgi:hypothetical protein
MYHAIDDAVIDAAAAGRLRSPSLAADGSQRCLRTDNRISTRAGVLTNPPLAESAIAQRKGLVEALAAYGVALGSLASGAPAAESAVALRSLQRAAFRLSVAAQQHATGDLFIEDLAAAFSSAVHHLATSHAKGDARRSVPQAKPTIEKLITILSSDVARRHAEALNAARLDYAGWLALYDVRRASPVTRTGVHAPAAALPRCAEPVLSSDAAPLAARDVASDGASFPGREAMLARLQIARSRYDALSAADPKPLLAALAALDEAAISALSRRAGAPALGALHDALARFRTAALQLSTASRPLSADDKT